MDTDFALTADYIELIKLLKTTGLCSTGGMAKVVVQQGLVKVDGQVERRARRKIRKGMAVSFEQHLITVQ